jgi:hypothetical protein
MVIKKLINKNTLMFFLILMILGTFYPFVFNELLFGNKKAVVTLILIGIWFVVFLHNTINNGIVFPDKKYMFFIGLIIIYFFIYGNLIDSQSIVGTSFGLCVALFFLVLFVNTIDIKIFSEYFIKYNVVSLILTIVGFIFTAFSIIRPFGIFGNAEEGMWSYVNYGLFFIKNFSTDDYMRPSGYYDEVGSFAYVIILLIIINRKLFNNRKWEILFLILPLFLTSLSAIINTAAFVLLYYTSKKNIKYFIVSIFSVIVVYLFFTSYSTKNSTIKYMNDRIVGRIEQIIKTGKDNGSRDGGFEWGPKIFAENRWGISPETVQKKYPEFVNETIWAPVLYYNPIGALIFFLPFLFVAYKSIINKDLEYLKYLILIAFLLVQRPQYNFTLYIILYYIILYYMPVTISKKT